MRSPSSINEENSTWVLAGSRIFGSSLTIPTPDTTVADILGSQFSANGKGPITVLNCLLHNAGFPPDPDPNYWCG